MERKRTILHRCELVRVCSLANTRFKLITPPVYIFYLSLQKITNHVATTQYIIMFLYTYDDKQHNILSCSCKPMMSNTRQTKGHEYIYIYGMFL